MPQQLPGTHCCMVGLDPQQPVSPAPATLPPFLGPEALEVAESNFCISRPWHLGQLTVS